MPGHTINITFPQAEDNSPIWSADKIEIFMSGGEVKVKFHPERQDGVSNRIREALKALAERNFNQ